MKISYNWLQSFFDKKLPAPAKLAELLTLHSFEVEGVEKNGRDHILECAILPNRAHDLLAHRGIARELSTILNLKLNTKNQIPKLQIKDQKTKPPFSVEVLDKKLCRRYIGLAVQGVKVGPSPKWLKERLESVSQKSINNIVDATNFVMLELGQPLHAFDADKLAGGKIVVRRAAGGEKMVTLDGVVAELDNEALVIADRDEALALAGIKGGKKAEIAAGTKNIIIEVANFEPANVRRTSRHVNIATDSSQRFAHGLHPELAMEAMTRVAQIILEVAGGKITGALVDIYNEKLKSPLIGVSYEQINSTLGVEVPPREVKRILLALGCELTEKKNGVLQVLPPQLRLDLALEGDIIEEVGRVYGYEKIRAVPPANEALFAPRNEAVAIRARAQDLLRGAGFMEAVNYSFIGERDAQFMGMNNLAEVLRLNNPPRPELSILRPTLIPGLAANLRDNEKRAATLNFFETGDVFFGNDEHEALGLASLSDKAKGEEIFYLLKGHLVSLLEHLGIADAWFDDKLNADEVGRGALAYLHPYQTALVKIGTEKIGVIGVLHPEFARAEKLRGGAAVLELDLTKLTKLVAREREFTPISKYPATSRDLAIIVPDEARMTEVEDVIQNSGGELLFDVDLFDVYDGEELGEGRRSLAFHLIFQSADKTLNDTEVDAIMKKIVSALEENADWEVRK
ncbi:MAG: phenylalanine--tRNA ligase subunit beta [Candidatus Niyogibacteria bacterium]|nr:phenylalanine--tRNA ligase subunit beta [Candidatus Niyogibacteria bacterium]